MTVMTGKPPDFFNLGSGALGTAVPAMGLRLRFFGRAQGLGVRNRRHGRLFLSRNRRINEEDGAEPPQFSLGVHGAAGFKGFPRLVELRLVFRGNGQVAADHVAGGQSGGAEFTHQHRLPFRGHGLV